MTEAEHQRLRLLVQADADGELSAAEAVRLADHLTECTPCRALREDLRHLSAGLRAGLPRYPATPGVRARLPGRTTPAIARPRRLALAGLTALAAGVAVLMLAPRTQTDGALREAVSAHIRGLQPDHLTDVPSSDRHTVKPWFAGKLDFAPPVRDLAARGFPLVGGRLDALDGRAVAVLVYRRDQHLIDLFVRPAEGSAPARARTIGGYNLVAWQDAGMAFIAVSDLELSALERFAALWRGKG